MKPFLMVSIGSNISSVLDGFDVFPFLSACFKLHASYLFDSDLLEQWVLQILAKMNDLMTKSFLSYVDLKKHAQKDIEANLEDSDEPNLSHAKVLRGLRDRMESDMVAVLRKAKIVKARLEALDRSNVTNRKISEAYKEGTPVDRTRMSVTNGLRVKLREMMNDFQSLREKILWDHKEDLKRRYYNATGEVPSEEVIEKMVSGAVKVQLFEGKTEVAGFEESSLNVAVLVETQGEKVDDIEENLAGAGNFLSGGTNSFYYIRQSNEEEQEMGLLGLCCSADYSVGVHHFFVGFLMEQGRKSSGHSQTLSLLERCSTMAEMKQIHAHIYKTGLIVDPVPMSRLLASSTSPDFGNLTYVRKVFDRISRPNTFMWNAMIRGYSNSNEPEAALLLIKSAHLLFDRLPQRDIVSWNSMIDGFSVSNLTMWRSQSSFSACAHLGALDQCGWIHAYMDDNGLEIDRVLIDMYAKCGDMEEALEVFVKLEKKGVYAWTVMINGFAMHGRGQEAIDWFVQMQQAGIKPNLITFTALLTACSHAGLVDDGKSMFKSMTTVYKLNPTIEHYGCMVDLLGRAGLLVEAKELIEKMPFKPNAAIWGALLNACWIHGHLELGKILIEIDPAHSGRYIHLARVHAAAGEWEQAFEIAEKLREEGYKPATGDLLLDLGDEEKERAIQYHSEKLAVAFGLIRTKPETTIWIFKNLRVCEDCHTVTKLISKIYARDIVVRDRIRFHHFKGGKCSCGD
ncbi:hypothetical protein FH972_012686 [Carpinus fangiana]|uniref:t-SNARE coiled-coil homology domain-containing protein n=1 Tax=Carpinus fangiana TaxID=176857 RepID=A0A5N6R639_9ROSI|nr:hypothetical protein FH972_012686 [Carpinus fangiana]